MNEYERIEMEAYLGRSIDNQAKLLRPYFKIGDRVLDVGCGPGAITLDVARIIQPGTVVGIDHVAHRIDKARELTIDRSCENASFVCGDASKLPFQSESFDVVYSHTVLHYFWDPAGALYEQARVLRPGGWLIAAGVRDWGLVNRYPACPNWEKVIKSRITFCEAVKDGNARYEWERRPCLAYTETGRRCAEWFNSLGLVNLTIQVEPYKIEYNGASEIESQMDLLPWTDPGTIGYNEEYRAEYMAMIEQGFLDKETLELAMKEASRWFQNRAAFHFYALIFAAGQKAINIS